MEEIPPDLDVAPFRLIETTTGHYSLLLTEFDEAAPVLEAAGHEAGGYAWAAIAGAVLAEHPELAGHLDLDPEASMFCAYGENRAALEALGLLLAAAWKDHATLARLAAVAPWDEWD